MITARISAISQNKSLHYVKCIFIVMAVGSIGSDDAVPEYWLSGNLDRTLSQLAAASCSLRHESS